MWKRFVAAGVIAAGVAVPLTAASAGAATTSTTVKSRDLTTERQRCESMIDARLTELTKLDGRVADAKNLTDAHRQTITDINSHARAALTDLKAKIDQDDDPAVLKQDCQSIVIDYRVFALRAPQEHLTIASDAETSAVLKMQDLEPKIQAAIDQAKAQGKDVTGAQQAFDDLKAKMSDAAAKDDKVADTVLGYTPADYDANHDVLTPARNAVKTAAADLHAARSDAKTIADDLRSQPSTTTSVAPSTTTTAAAQ
jgi:hypothetical protein